MFPEVAVRARVLGFTMILTAASCASTAHADPEADAKDLFTRGRALRAQGNCLAAVQDFRKAVAIFPSGLGSVRNMAECEEQLGHWASARRTWLDLKRALLSVQDAKYDGWDAEAAGAAERLAPKVARLTVEVVVAGSSPAPAPSPSGVEVLLNGELLPASLIGTALERDPGSYRVRVQGKAVPFEETVALVAGDDRQVQLRVEMKRAPDESHALPSPVVPEDANRTRRLAGWVSLGVGGAALVGAGISFLVRQSALGDLERACPEYERQACDAGLESTVDRGKLGATLANVFGVIGVLGAGAGVALILTSPSPAPQPGFGVRPVVGRVNGFTAQWVFQ